MKTSRNFLPRNLIFAGLIVLITFFSGCSKDDDERGTNEIWMQNNAFNPSTMTVAVNTSVKWINKDGTNHSATSDSLIFDSNTLGNNGEFSFVFTAAGTYPYHCKFHNGMKGQIIVQ